MAIAVIDSWLNDPRRTYDLGKQLYEQYGDNKLLKSLFSKGHQTSHYHFTRLNQALVELNAKIVITPINIPVVKIPKIEDIPLPAKYSSLTDIEWLKLPDSVKDMYTRVYRLHPHTQLLFNQSRITDNEDGRLQLDLLIVQERGEINRLWQSIKEYHATGHIKENLQLAEAPKIAEMPLNALIKLSKNIPSYLSKDRDRIKTMPDGPHKNKVLNRIMEREVQLALVKKRLEGEL